MVGNKVVRLSMVDKESGEMQTDLGDVVISGLSELLPKELTYRGTIFCYTPELPKEQVGSLRIEFGKDNTVLISINGSPVLSAKTIPEMEVAKMFHRELKHCNK